MKVESVTKVSIFYIIIGVSVLLFFNYRIVTSLFHYEGGVHYQGEYFFLFVQVLLLFFNCIFVMGLLHYEGGVCYQGEYFLHVYSSKCIIVFLQI